MQIQTYNNFLTPELHTDVVNKTLYAREWYFGGVSSDNSNGVLFWKLDLDKDLLFNDVILRQIIAVTGKNLKLKRVYANGQTTGLCGSFHVDAFEDNCYTFLYYVNPIWDVVYGGETIFFNQMTKQTHIELFSPNKGVFFKSNILHAGMEPTRHCNNLRVTLAYKLEE